MYIQRYMQRLYMYISRYRSLFMARFKILRVQNLEKIKKNKNFIFSLITCTKQRFFSFILYKRKKNTYNKIREERVDIIKNYYKYPIYLKRVSSQVCKHDLGRLTKPKPRSSIFQKRRTNMYQLLNRIQQWVKKKRPKGQ